MQQRKHPPPVGDDQRVFVAEHLEDRDQTLAPGFVLELGIAAQDVHELLQRRFVSAGQHIAGGQLPAGGAVIRRSARTFASSAARSGAP
jgi:hypothetical protein